MQVHPSLLVSESTLYNTLNGQTQHTRQFQSVHYSAMQLQPLAGGECVATPTNLTLVPVVHVRVQVEVVFRLRHKLLTTICGIEWQMAV